MYYTIMLSESLILNLQGVRYLPHKTTPKRSKNELDENFSTVYIDTD